MRQYGKDEEVWVVAVMGNQCVYYNEIEEGWGWGNFTSWGTILGHHWQQDEIHHVILKALDGMRKQSLPIDDATALNEQ